MCRRARSRLPRCGCCAWIRRRHDSSFSLIPTRITSPAAIRAITGISTLGWRLAGGERGLLGLLAVDRERALAVVELKASADLHLPLQALDYWIRVKWHLDRGDFSRHGYFPGIELRPEPPRLFLVCPCLEFHSTTETILSYFSPGIDVERIGLGVEWRKGLNVVFRFTGAQRPH